MNKTLIERVIGGSGVGSNFIYDVRAANEVVIEVPEKNREGCEKAARVFKRACPLKEIVHDAKKQGERAKRASLDEDEHTRDEVREMATDIMATSTTKLS